VRFSGRQIRADSDNHPHQSVCEVEFALGRIGLNAPEIAFPAFTTWSTGGGLRHTASGMAGWRFT
jgi:hypothetical protein